MKTVEQLRALMSNPNVTGFSRLIRGGESNQSYDAYRIINGGAHFSDFSGHPYGEKKTTEGGKASGAHQWLPTTWADLKRRYPVDCANFGPVAQEFGVVAKLQDRGALDDVLAGNIGEAIRKCRQEWTSLPGAAENTSYTLTKALAVYQQYGGKLAQSEAPAAPEPPPRDANPAPAPKPATPTTPDDAPARLSSEELTDVPAAEVDAIIRSFKAEGAKILTKTRQSNGLYTIRAEF